MTTLVQLKTEHERTPADWEIIKSISTSGDAETYLQLKSGDLTGFDSHKEAEKKMLEILAYYSNGDAGAIERIYRGTDLYFTSDTKNKTQQNQRLAAAIEKAVKWAIDMQAQQYAKDATDKIIEIEKEWPEPIDLDRASRNLPIFPTDALGKVRGYVESSADYFQVPVDLPAVLALTAIGAAAAVRKYKIQPRNGWEEPPNLFTLTVLPTGEKKTSVMREITRPFHQYMQEQNELISVDRAKALAEKDILESQIEDIKKTLRKATGTDRTIERENLSLAIEELAEHEVPPLVDLISSDITAEALAEQLQFNDERMAIFTDEAGLLDTINGRYSNGIPNLDVYLQSYSASPMNVHRKGKPTVHLDAPMLTIGMLAQPVAVEKILRVKGSNDTGLLARFLYSLPNSSRIGHRLIDTDPIPDTLKEFYNDLIIDLLSGQGKPSFNLTFDAQAQQAFKTYREQLEVKRRDGGEHADILEWSQKIDGVAARISLILHLAAGYRETTPVSLNTLNKAIKIIEYFSAHAMCALTVGSGFEREKAALELIKKRSLDKVKPRDLQRFKKTRFPTSGDAREVLASLEILNYVQHDRKNDVYYVNPRLK
ncbi:MAG: YfjI family protein [Bacillota bacterium]|nr:YfjI family protein [Bacillota bacterium]MDW7677619.1 YfjI family protein [Bacillota bacterium]